MRIEISALFYLLSVNEPPVRNGLIGDGVYIQELEEGWIQGVRDRCPKVVARELLEVRSPYTHRLFYEAATAESSEISLISPKDQQPLVRAISLSRIVKPTSIPYSNIWVKSVYDDSGRVHHFSEPVINAFSVAFGIKKHEWNTITQSDASEMANLWGSLSHFLDDNYEPTYRRIVRALKYYELSHAIYFAEMRHPILHAALESMVCTGRPHNKAQVTQRLPKLVSFISVQQAEDIYSVCCDFKHSAQAILQKSGSKGVIDPSDLRRIDAVNLLHESVRHLLLESLKNRSFADILVDLGKLRQTYQAFDSKGRLV